MSVDFSWGGRPRGLDWCQFIFPGVDGPGGLIGVSSFFLGRSAPRSRIQGLDWCQFIFPGVYGPGVADSVRFQD